ncbi:MAG: diguanylate cyclase [Fimbriimonas sp.]
MLAVGTWEYLPATGGLVVSPSLRKLLPFPKGERIELADGFHPQDRLKVRRLLNAAYEEPGEYRTEFRVLDPDGRERLIAFACRTVEGPMGTRITGVCQDITEWRTTETVLRGNEDRWQAALRGSNFGVWDWDLRTNLLVVSGLLAETLGYPPDHVPAPYDVWTEHLHPEDRRPTLIAIQEHLANKTQQYRMEHRLRHQDGTYRWMLARGAAMFDEDGRPYRMVGICTDITRRVETRMALEESEARLRAIVDGSFDGLLILEVVRNEDGSIADFIFAQVNGRALDMMNATSDDILGARLLERFPEALKSGIFDRFVRVVQTQERDLHEFMGLGEHDGDRFYRQQIVPVGNGVAVALNDVTDRLAHEQALRATEKLVSEIASAVPEFLYVMDMRVRRITYRNRSLRAALGYTDRTEIGHGEPLLHEILEEEDQARVLDLEARVIRGTDEDALEIEVRARRADGGLDWLSLRHSIFARDEFGNPTHMLGSASIVTHRKRAEERMREHVLALNRTQAELQVRQSELEKLNARLMQLARKDGLTDVYNHRAFQERLSEEVARARRNGHPLTLMLGDVDDFKKYNDRFGHVAGDERLQFFGQVLQRATRPSDFVARYGGEEFAIILPETTTEQGLIVGERILETLAQEQGPKRITASFGLVEFSENCPTPAALIETADAALYTAKHTGKNRISVAQPGARLG